MKRDLAVVSSPLQYLNATEWLWASPDARADLVLLGDRAGGEEAILRLMERHPAPWLSVIRHPGRPRQARWTPKLAKDLADIRHRSELGRLAARIGPRRQVVFGDYRNVSQRALIARVPHDELVLVDDGSVAPQVAAARSGDSAPEAWRFSPGWLRTALARSVFGERAPHPPGELCFFSIYGRLIEPTLAAGDRAISHRYQGWRALFAEAPRGDAVWLLGSNHVEAGICALEDYRALVFGGLETLRAEGRAGPYLYRPHRGEDEAKAAALAREGRMTLAVADAPVEIAYLDAPEKPSLVVVVASSAADTLSVLDPALEIARLAPPSGYLRKQRGHISAVIAGHDAFNPRLRVVSPAIMPPEARNLS